MPICVSCKKDKDPAEFGLKKRAGTRNKTCTPCVSAQKAHYQANKEARRKYQRERYHQAGHKANLLAYQRSWTRKNPGYVRNYIRQRCETDALYARRIAASGELMGMVFSKDLDRYSPTLGCTVGELRAHIESLFKPGMTWDNHGRGGWHLDHIFPLSVAMKAGEEAFNKALNYRNVQPLWEHENMAKFASMPEQWPTIEAFLKAW